MAFLVTFVFFNLSNVQSSIYRAVQTYPVTQPTRRPDQNRSETADPTYFGGQQRIFSTKNQLRRVSFGFSPPKTRTDRRKTHNPTKT